MAHEAQNAQCADLAVLTRLALFRLVQLVLHYLFRSVQLVLACIDRCHASADRQEARGAVLLGQKRLWRSKVAFY